MMPRANDINQQKQMSFIKKTTRYDAEILRTFSQKKRKDFDIFLDDFCLGLGGMGTIC